MVSDLKKKTAAESYAVDCRPLPGALGELAVDMPSVDLVVMAIETAQAMVMVSATHSIISIWALLLVIHCHFVLNFCSVTDQAVAPKQLKRPVQRKH